MSEPPTLCIGDVHGHFDRLEALLVQEGIVGGCPDCNGFGMIDNDDPDQGEITVKDCPDCHGDGQRRINHDVRVVQLGDLGHFGGSTGSPSGDRLCYEYANRYLDTVLWGNHDRAVFDGGSIFNGYEYPGDAVRDNMLQLIGSKKMQMATAAHGHLIVHAGVHKAWSELAKEIGNAQDFADHLNTLDRGHMRKTRAGVAPERSRMKDTYGIITQISQARGGPDYEGGVLWMDWNMEAHLEGPFPFVCGHTANFEGIVEQDQFGNWNIDIGGKYQERLAGLWLEKDRDPRMVKIEERKGLQI